MGVSGGGTGQAVQGEGVIYVVTANEMAVQRIDATTYMPIRTIERFGVNAIAIYDDTLWTAAGQPFNVTLRFDSDPAARLWHTRARSR